MAAIFSVSTIGWLFNRSSAAMNRSLPTPCISCLTSPANAPAVGVLTLVHPQPGYFSENDLNVVTAIADQAGVAVENARLFTSEQKRRLLASTLQEIARSINASLDPNQVLPLAVDQLDRLVTFDPALILRVEGEPVRVVAA
jgi:GAF domain-containing protein